MNKIYNVPTANEILDMLKDNKTEVIKGFSDVVNENACYQRNVFIGDIEPEIGESVEAIIRFYNQVDEEKGLAPEDREPIKIIIDSGGGDLCATFTMIDAIKLSKTPIWGINIGTAYSGGFFTYIACHKRFAYPHSTWLYHEGSTMNGGDAGKFRNFADFYQVQLQMLKDIVLDNTKITDELYESKKRDDWWITTKEAIDLGICDEILEELIY